MRGKLVERVVLTPQDPTQAAELDKLVSEFAERLAVSSEDCVFYLSAPDLAAHARVVETETTDTLEQFMLFVQSQLDFPIL